MLLTWMTVMMTAAHVRSCVLSHLCLRRPAQFAWPATLTAWASRLMPMLLSSNCLAAGQAPTRNGAG